MGISALTEPNLTDPSEYHEDPRSGPSAIARLRTYLLTGLVVAGPIGITLWLSWSFINWIDQLVKPLIPAVYNPETYLPVEVPGIGLVAAVLGLVLIGFFTANFAGRTVLGLGEQFVARMPVIRSVYSGLKQIFETVLSQSGTTFQRAGLIEYPRKGLWAMVFIATHAKGETAAKLAHKDQMLSVFLPTTPNPTSGFLLFVPEKDVIELDMSVEDAAKLVISAGLVAPQNDEGGRVIAAPVARELEPT